MATKVITNQSTGVGNTRSIGTQWDMSSAAVRNPLFVRFCR
jgi:hypothetical protein